MYNVRIAILTEIPRIINEVYKSYKIKYTNDEKLNKNRFTLI